MLQGNDSRGARASLEPYSRAVGRDSVRRAKIRAYGEMLHSFISLADYTGPFVPQLFDYHPQAVPAPYNHSNGGRRSGILCEKRIDEQERNSIRIANAASVWASSWAASWLSGGIDWQETYGRTGRAAGYFSIAQCFASSFGLNNARLWPFLVDEGAGRLNDIGRVLN